MSKNIPQYGDLPLSVVQRIASTLYSTKTYIDTDTDVVMVEKEKGLIAFKPLQNPGHIVQVLHRLLSHENICSMSLDDGHYKFAYIKLITSEDIIHNPRIFRGTTIWEAAVLTVLHILDEEQA